MCVWHDAAWRHGECCSWLVGRRSGVACISRRSRCDLGPPVDGSSAVSMSFNCVSSLVVEHACGGSS